MNAFEFGKYAFDQYGIGGVKRLVSSPHVGVVNKALGIAGAVSYYNPYIAAISAAPVVYEGAKWLVDQF